MKIEGTVTIREGILTWLNKQPPPTYGFQSPQVRPLAELLESSLVAAGSSGSGGGPLPGILASDRQSYKAKAAGLITRSGHTQY